MNENAASTPIPHTANAWLVAGIVALHVALVLVLPFLLAQSGWWALLLVGTAWIHSTHWGLIHEGIHKLLHPDAATNERMGRLLGILMGASFHVLRFGHLMHHKLNRDWHSEWVDNARWRDRMGYYMHLTIGLYLSEVMTSLLVALLPRERAIRLARRTVLKHHPDVGVAAERFFYDRNNVRMVREDMAFSAAFFATALWAMGPYWVTMAAFIAIRALVVSFLDNIYHYATPTDNSKAGKELQLPDRWSRLLLHGNYHETHHLNPHVPWTGLPATHAAQGRPFNGEFSRHALMQLGGPMVNYA